MRTGRLVCCWYFPVARILHRCSAPAWPSWLACSPPPPVAQPQKPVPTAITNARVVVSADKTLEKATVILRDGLIADVVEGDALVPAGCCSSIDGSGLTVHPGLIDAASTARVRPGPAAVGGWPAGPGGPGRRHPGGHEAGSPQGAHPEVRGAVRSQGGRGRLAPWRRLGFTAHLAMPEGGFFSGQSALVSLSGAVPRDAVLRPVVFQHAALKSFPGPDYPRALMGVIAHCRQALLDAGWHARQRRRSRPASSSGARPTFDPALDALNPRSKARSAVVFEADSADEIHRALDFADEFKLKPVILGGRDAWKVTDRLKADRHARHPATQLLRSR